MVREDTPGLEQLVAYVATPESDNFDTQGALRYLQDKLPAYMVPAHLIALPMFPLTANGKLDRSALPSPEAGSAEQYVAPRTATEEQLAAIWTGLLGVERVGVYDDFFALGGHSLVAMQFVSRIMDTMQVSLPIDALFKSPTVAGVAEAIELRKAGATAAATEENTIKAISRGARRTRRPLQRDDNR